MTAYPLDTTSALTRDFTGRELRIAKHLAGMPMLVKQIINGIVVERVAEGSWHVGAARHQPVTSVVRVLVSR